MDLDKLIKEISEELAIVSVDPPRVQAAFKAGLCAQFPFLSDAKLTLTQLPEGKGNKP